MRSAPEEQECPDCGARLTVHHLGEYELSYVCPRVPMGRGSYAEGLLDPPPSVEVVRCRGCGESLGPGHEPSLSARERLECRRCGFSGERMAPVPFEPA